MTFEQEPHAPHAASDLTRFESVFDSPDPSPERLREFIGVLYGELRRYAQACIARQPPGHSLQATALVHEAFVRLAGQRTIPWHNRAYFFTAAIKAIRRLIVEHARARHCLKRGEGWDRTDLDSYQACVFPESSVVDALALDEAIERLQKQDPILCRIVCLRYFAGLTIPQTAQLMEISESAVKNGWRSARAWLKRELTGLPPDPTTGPASETSDA